MLNHFLLNGCVLCLKEARNAISYKQENQMSYSFAGRSYNKYKPFFSYEHKDYSFKVDMEFGELLFARKLISFSGKHLPLDLSLKYIQRHIYDNFYTNISFPLGFKTNYHVFLEYDSSLNGYKYEDMDGFEHDFKLAINSSTLYYDTFGSGLMLIVENNGYKVFDDDGNYQLFDTYGRLVKIHKKITSSHDAEQIIHYSSNLTIDYIADNYGRTISFSYSGASIQISYGNNVVVTLYTTNNRLTKISKNIDGHLVEETINQYNLINDIFFESGEKLEFSYTGDELSFLQNSIGQDAFAFSYYQTNDQSYATVTNARGISTRYDFSEDNSVSQTTDNNYNVDLSFLKINSNIDSCIVKSETENDEIIQFTFGNNNTFTIDTLGNTNGFSNNVVNTNLQAKKMYLLIAEISGNLALDSFEIQLFDYDDNLLANLIFKGKTRKLSFPVGIRASTQKQFYLKYFNRCPNSVEINKVRLVPLIGDFEMLCTNIDFGGPIFFYGDEPYYLLKESGVTLFNNNQILHLNLGFAYSDYLANERLFYKNYPSHIWCNDKTKLIDGVTSLLNIFNTSQYLRYSLSQGGIVYCTYDGSSLTPQTFVSFYKIKGKDDNSFSLTKFSHCSPSFHTGYTTYYYEEMETKYIAGSNGYVTFYDYDENYSLVELNRDDGYKEEYSYDSNGNLLSKIVSNGNLLGLIKNEFSYDSHDNLISETNLLGSSTQNLNYSYDNYSNISQISYPNSLIKNINYDSVTGERVINNTFVANNNTITQNNNYIDESNRSFSVSSNTYLFNYIDGRLNSVSYNNQNILSISYTASTSQSGFVIYYQETIDYSNNCSVYIEYDAFDRLSAKDDSRYQYDEYSRLINIIDEYYSFVCPMIIYSYDYYDQITESENKNGFIKVFYTYDDYRRLINQTFEQSNSGLYEIDYSYYNKPDLENIIKESSIIYGNTTINVTDNVDGFSRLTTNSVSFGNNSINKTFTYCTGGSNNSLTNQFLASVAWSYVVNNQTSSSGIDAYSYDSVGNIVFIERYINNVTTLKFQYYYDSFSRLIRENNTMLGRTFGYAFDANGNITAKYEYVYTESPVLYNPPIAYHYYTYDSVYPNRLVSFDNQAITYDSVGNPLSYRGKSLTWSKGTLLSQVVDGSETIDLYYDSFNQRVRKETESVTTYFKYVDGKLIKQEQGNTNQSITYLYSHQGIIGFVLSGYDSSLDGTYIYEKSIQQDVMTIRDVNNQIKAIYAYDAWGNHKVLNPNGTENTSSTFIGNINPIRYRSYYYDTDLKMYWLTTRYYDPEVGRFISPDHYSYLDYQKLHGLNLYAYSKNNPVMYYDPSGHIVIFLLALLAISSIKSRAKSMAESAIERTELEEGDNKTKDFDLYGNKDVYVELSDHTKIYYYISGDINDWDNEMMEIVILDCWQYDLNQMIEFATKLKATMNSNALNVKRMVNEWYWHKIAFYSGISKGSTRSANIYLDSPDTNHGVKSWVINHCWWFY